MAQSVVSQDPIPLQVYNYGFSKKQEIKRSYRDFSTRMVNFAMAQARSAPSLFPAVVTCLQFLDLRYAHHLPVSHTRYPSTSSSGSSAATLPISMQMKGMNVFYPLPRRSRWIKIHNRFRALPTRYPTCVTWKHRHQYQNLGQTQNQY